MDLFGEEDVGMKITLSQNTEKNKQNKKLNEDNTKLNADNKALNEKNTKRNNAYAEAVTTAKTTNSGEYAVKRNTLRALDVDDEVKNILEGEFKTFIPR